MYRVPPALILATAGIAALGGCATTPEEDPVQTKLNDLETRVTRIERVVANQSLVDLAQHQEAQQAELRDLRGQIDQLQHDNATLRKQQHDLYADLDQRVKALGTASAATASPPPAGGGSSPSSGSGDASSTEQAIYSQAFDALKAGSYSTAITGFRDFLSGYPQSPLAENAQYWLGESYYVNHDYDSAAEAFRTVLRKWPDSRKGSDALLKLGYTQFEQKQWAAARTTLTAVTQKYPGSDAAKLASEKLKRIPAQ